jgi:hypothetical protein
MLDTKDNNSGDEEKTELGCKMKEDIALWTVEKTENMKRKRKR